MAKGALKLVEKPSFFVDEGSYWSTESSKPCHSIHYALSYPQQTSPEVAAFAISRFSKRGDVVLDPFLGSGTTALEALVAGRIAFGSDVNPFFVKVARAKLQPADITEVTLRLQLINVKRPVAVESFRKGFSSFFDIDTFREIVCLKEYLREREDRVSRFIELVALSLLHGHSAGYFSVYSMPHLSLSPDEQERINRKRSQSPEYRAVIPRLLRRAAMVLRDGVPSVMVQQERQSRIAVRDARDLSYAPSASVNLVCTTPPLPGARKTCVDQWLRLWFSGIEPQIASGGEATHTDLAEWRVFMNETLLELARVTRAGGRCVLDLREIQTRPGAPTIRIDEELLPIVEKELSRFWDPECLLVHQPKAPRVQNQLKARGAEGQSHRLLVLRRR